MQDIGLYIRVYGRQTAFLYMSAKHTAGHVAVDAHVAVEVARLRKPV